MQTISGLLGILIMSSLINNVVLSQFLGLCPFLGVSKKVESAVGMGGAIVFVITIASLVCGLLYKFILVPLDLTYLNTIVFILIIAMLVQFVEMFLKKFVKPLYESLGVYLPLITTNCAVLGVALLNVTNEYSILEGIVNGFATAVGFTISITILAGIREKIEYNDIPESWKGTPIVVITAGLMAIAFTGFSVLR
ncbi:RnfABCDGE type electron transport complex subunit A [Butyrivibrio sp. NC3005]|jgi:electron transport complex protein RnfA|uniref:electron transport complex protein RnfA n=1 Tax=Butyrivibrio sp. NC3005 TaxID=1280685 RepID=UPI00041CA3EB|nr:RnfABCDGE type electron transport complex subunit A [Butyrivibrio sp. NC3005]